MLKSKTSRQVKAAFFLGSQKYFIEASGKKVLTTILNKRSKSKYFSILVDATPDCSQEQLTFIFGYLQQNDDGIANEMIDELEKYDILLIDCRNKGFDNGENMVGG